MIAGSLPKIVQINHEHFISYHIIFIDTIPLSLSNRRIFPDTESQKWHTSAQVILSVEEFPGGEWVGEQGPLFYRNVVVFCIDSSLAPIYTFTTAPQLCTCVLSDGSCTVTYVITKSYTDVWPWVEVIQWRHTGPFFSIHASDPPLLPHAIIETSKPKWTIGSWPYCPPSQAKGNLGTIKHFHY